MEFARIEIQTLARTFAHRIEKLKDFEWRTFLLVAATSFAAASVASTVLGYVLIFVLQKSLMRPVQHHVEEVVLNIPSVLVSIKESDLKRLLERNIFNSANEQEDPTKSQESQPGETIVRTSLPIKLVGLIYGGDPYSGLAVVESTDRPGVANSFLVGDVIAPDQRAIVKEILRDRILINVSGRVEYAALEDQEIRRSSRKRSTRTNSGSSSSSFGSLAGSDAFATEAPPEFFKEEGFERKGSNIELSTQYKQRLLGADFANVLQDAKATPNMTAEGIKGFRLDRIRKNSIYEKAGLMNSDIVEEINGVPLTDAGQAIKLMQSLANESEVELRVNRNGQKINFTMKVK